MTKKKTKFRDDLKFSSGSAPADLQAFRLAQRLFWYQAVHGGNDTLQTLYDRICEFKNRLPETEDEQSTTDG